MGKEMMGEQHRLGSLKVCITGHNHRLMCIGLLQTFALEFSQQRIKISNAGSQVHPFIERDLIVAASSCVEFPSHGSNFFDEPLFYRHMDIFSDESTITAWDALEQELAGFNLPQNLLQRLLYPE